MLSGFFVSQAQHLGYIVAVAWMPFIFYYALSFTRKPELRSGLLLAATLSLELSGGYAGYFVTLGYLLLGLGAYRLVQRWRSEGPGTLPKWLLAHAGVAVAFVLLSFVVLVGSFEIKPFINRGEPLVFDNSVWGVLSGSTPPQAVVGWLFPFAVAFDKEYWGTSLSLLNAQTGNEYVQQELVL